MKRIVIRDFGPIKEADILLKDVNIIIGEQSIGKSCVLKVSCFCAWVEKRIEIEQNPKRFEKAGNFIEELVNFHRLNGYAHEKTYIGYESDFMKIDSTGKAALLFKSIPSQLEKNASRYKVSLSRQRNPLRASAAIWYSCFASASFPCL